MFVDKSTHERVGSEISHGQVRQEHLDHVHTQLSGQESTNRVRLLRERSQASTNRTGQLQRHALHSRRLRVAFASIRRGRVQARAQPERRFREERQSSRARRGSNGQDDSSGNHAIEQQRRRWGSRLRSTPPICHLSYLIIKNCVFFLFVCCFIQRLIIMLIYLCHSFLILLNKKNKLINVINIL